VRLGEVDLAVKLGTNKSLNTEEYVYEIPSYFINFRAYYCKLQGTFSD